MNNAGHMPIKSRYGFVTADATTRDVAHELGHGVFNLRHTFSEENSFTLQEGDTENLMDYSSGTELWKHQWDFIHNPEGGWHIFEDVEEGMIESKEKVAEILNKIRYAFVNETSISFNNDFSNFVHAQNITLLDGNIYNKIVISPSGNGTIEINPKQMKEDGLIINEFDVNTGLRCISLYNDFDIIFKIIYDSEVEGYVSKFENYLFPTLNTWTSQLYERKYSTINELIEGNSEYVFQVDKNTGETAIYYKKFVIEDNSDQANKLAVYKQELFFLIDLLNEPVFEVISEFREKHEYEFQLSDGKVSLIDEDPVIENLPNTSIPELNGEFTYYISQPDDALAYVTNEQPLIKIFYELLKTETDLVKNGDLSMLSLTNQFDNMYTTVVEVLLIGLETYLADFSLPYLGLNDIVGPPPQVIDYIKYEVPMTEEEEALIEWGNQLNNNN